MFWTSGLVYEGHNEDVFFLRDEDQRVRKPEEGSPAKLVLPDGNGERELSQLVKDPGNLLKEGVTQARGDIVVIVDSVSDFPFS